MFLFEIDNSPRAKQEYTEKKHKKYWKLKLNLEVKTMKKILMQQWIIYIIKHFVIDADTNSNTNTVLLFHVTRTLHTYIYTYTII